MKHAEFLLVLFLFCQLFAEVFDAKNILDTNFLQYWNKTLSITQAERMVKISVFIFGEENLKESEPQNAPTDGLETLKIPEITITYNDTAGFEIYQSNFENFPSDSNFIIRSSFFNDIIPEANAFFKNGEPEHATEYILANVQELLYAPKIADEIIEQTEDEKQVPSTADNNLTLYIYLTFILTVVVVFVILWERNKKKNKNRSYLFKGMPKNDFFGGGFDSI